MQTPEKRNIFMELGMLLILNDASGIICL